MADTYQKPFSMGYALRTTTKYMRKAIDISIRKTLDRLPEFVEDQAKSQEVFKTLAHLHSMRKELDKFQAEHSEIFAG
jgi:hypothetical protein